MKYIKLFEGFLNEARKFTKWVRPDKKTLALEFRVEHELKGHNFFDSLEDFLEKANSAKPVEVDSRMDRQIGYRSYTDSYDALVGLLSTYRSWGTYRSEEKLQNIYNRLKENKDMDMPIVLKWKNGQMRVFSGNTRMDVAFQLGINPTVLMIELDK